MCAEISKSAVQPGLISLADDSISSLSSADMTVPVPVPIVDNSVIKGKFNMNNCVDVHFGPKYEHSGDVVIHQNIFKSRDHLTLRNSSMFQRFCSGELYCCFLNCKVVTLITTVTFMCFVLLTFVLLIYFQVFNQTATNDLTADPINDGSVILTSQSSKKLDEEYPLNKMFVWRESWGAAQPVEESLLNTLPVERIILIHTVSAGTCNKFSSCKRQVLQIQELHMDEDHNYGDIGYNFVIGSDGYIYVGLGWDKVGSHTLGFNWNSLGVAFVGDFRTDQPNSLMMSSLRRLLDFGVEIHKLSENYQLYGHCQVVDFFPLSPGRNLMQKIKTYPHWNNTNFNHCK